MDYIVTNACMFKGERKQPGDVLKKVSPKEAAWLEKANVAEEVPRKNKAGDDGGADSTDA